MPTPKRGPRIGGSPSHQKHIMANMASDLFRHGRIRTTEAKAKALRPYAEKLITKAKAGDLHSRRQVLSTLRNKDVTAYLFEDVAPRFVDRPGGYTRILKLGPRPGDNARMAIIELVDRGAGSGEEQIEESKAARGRGLFGRRRKNVGGSAVAVAERVEDEVSISSESSDSSMSSDSSVSEDSPAAAEVEEVVEDAAPADEAVAEADDAPADADADEAADDEAGDEKA